MDAQRLKDNFAQVARQGDAVALFFYADLFVRDPPLRDMFPVGMGGQRDKLLGALGHIVAQVDNLPELVPFLRELGRGASTSRCCACSRTARCRTPRASRSRWRSLAGPACGATTRWPTRRAPTTPSTSTYG